MDVAYRLSNLGEFADEAKTLLKSMTKYSGHLGSLLDLIDGGFKVYQLGNKSQEDTIEYYANLSGIGIGVGLGFVPLVGAALSMVYTYADGDVWVQNNIKNLIIKHFPEEDENTPPGNQGPGL